MTALRRSAAHCRAWLLTAALAVAGVLTAAAPGGTPAAAAATAPCVSMTGTQPASPSPQSTFLNRVVVRSPCDAWTVGGISASGNGPSRTLIEHWDGARWTQAPSQDPGSAENTLLAVAATSATNAWAVGWYVPAGAGNADTRTLIEHWDGTSWTLAPQSASSIPGQLDDVSGTGWAVGSQPAGGGLIEHWNGRVWSVAPGPDLGAAIVANLTGVSATSPSNIWAVGYLLTPGLQLNTIIEHYDGTGWTLSPSPDFALLDGVAATSPADAWAAGLGPNDNPLVLHYDGTSWVPVPVQGGGGLGGVSASSPASVWAVGDLIDQGEPSGPLALHLRCC